jgi:hypothetical protein
VVAKSGQEPPLAVQKVLEELATIQNLCAARTTKAPIAVSGACMVGDDRAFHFAFTVMTALRECAR